VGLFVLIAYWTVIGGDPGPTAGDRWALDLCNDIRATWLNDVTKAFTNLGSGAVTWPLAALAAIWLALRRRWMEFWALVAGMILIIVMVHEIKAWTDRPRPADPIVSAAGSAFPSGHAAYATVYSWLAVTVALRVVPGITRRSLLVAAGLVLTLLVGLTRVYLRVHWLSDVSSGWALGLSCFAATAAVVLLIAHIRDNPRRHERAHQLDSGAGAGAGH
jgi:undecaprenyl-diphosphatase